MKSQQVYQVLVDNKKESEHTLMKCLQYIIHKYEFKPPVLIRWYSIKAIEFLDQIYLTQSEDMHLFIDTHATVVDELFKKNGGIGLSVKDMKEFNKFRDNIK